MQIKYRHVNPVFLKVGLFLWLIAFFLPFLSVAQISEGGAPPSFLYTQTLRNAAVPTQVPVDFYVEDLRLNDEWQARFAGSPTPIAKLIPVDYTMDNAGSRTTLPGGERIWQLSLKADNAIAIMLYYRDFYIPEGGKLFIYSADKSQLLGAYTHRTHPSGGSFATEFVGGDELILEYVESETSNDKPRICINEVGYGYNTAALREFYGITTRATSGSCMVNVNCEEGAAWQKEKKSVCYMVMKIGRSTKSFICTGSLVNNTAEDFKPFLLTARHCASGDGYVANEADMKQWLFYFHREREECSNSSLSVASKTMTGCKMVVNTGSAGSSDGMLLLLNEEVPEAYDVFYNGWDNSGVVGNSGVGIHHPSGDYKKISTYDTPTANYTFIASEFIGATNAYWNVIFKETLNGHAVTEGGSSGSPLYNENKLVIGTLTGGNSSCAAPKGLNIYGKMSAHWNRTQTDSSTRMDVWLDPINSGVETLSGRYRKVFKPAPLDLKITNLGNNVSLTWKKPEGDEAPAYYNVYRNNAKIGETENLFFLDESPVAGSLLYSVSAIYASGEESLFTNATLSFVEYKAPSDLTAERKSGFRDVTLNWKAPVYEQTIFWGSLNISVALGFTDSKPFYYGQKWLVDEIAPLHEKTITGVQFVPIETHTYEIFISQGERTYSQKIPTSSLRMLELNTITLNNPFVIDGTKSMIVSIYVSHVGDGKNHPAVGDNGPDVYGKGNMYSHDGKTWKIYNEESPDKHKYNFVIAAIVSSESGSLVTDVKNDSRAASGGRNMNVPVHKETRNEQPDEQPLIFPSVIGETSVRNQTEVTSSRPAAFPEITRYRIYRGGMPYDRVIPPKTIFVDTDVNMYNYYEVSAFYGTDESEKSNKASITVVTTDEIGSEITLHPTRFFDYIDLKGSEFVRRMEVFSVAGKCCLILESPDERIQTSSLTPGIYFFRIYGKDNRVKVFKAIKTQ